MKKHKLMWSLKEKRGFWLTEALSAASERLELSFNPLFFVKYKAGHFQESEYNKLGALPQWQTTDKPSILFGHL